jgi:hypothetical protein
VLLVRQRVRIFDAPGAVSVGHRLPGCLLSALVRFDALKRLVGPLVRLLGARDGRHGPAAEGSVALFRGDWRRFRNARVRVSRMIKRFLLLVKDVSTQVLSSLVVVKLGLMRVAAVLGETQFGLTPIGRVNRGKVSVIGGRAVSVQCDLGLVEALLVAVSPDLFALGDALVEVDKRLFLIEFSLLTGS